MKQPLTMEQRALVAVHYRFAEKLADRHHRSCQPPEDRRQEAYIGLMHAARDFDPSRGVKFEAFAEWRIIGAIRDAERRAGSRLLALKRADKRDGGKQVKVAFADSTIAGVDDDGNAMTLADIKLVAHETTDAVDDRDAIDAALKGLPDQEWYIANRYLCGFATMKTTGMEIGVSESRVSQLVRLIIERLRDHTALSHYAKGV